LGLPISDIVEGLVGGPHELKGFALSRWWCTVDSRNVNSCTDGGYGENETHVWRGRVGVRPGFRL
jgi:hypothetical protein